MKQDAIIVDRDGTLASCFMRPTDRHDSSWDAFNAALPFDAVVPVVSALIRSIRPGVAILMTSGRAEGDWPGDRRRRFLMQDWIVKHDLPITHLFMRVGGDQRRDSVVKQEILNRDILPFFNVRFVIDDRPQVVDMWRANGLSVLQVTDPEISPFILNQ